MQLLYRFYHLLLNEILTNLLECLDPFPHGVVFVMFLDDLIFFETTQYLLKLFREVSDFFVKALLDSIEVIKCHSFNNIDV